VKGGRGIVAPRTRQGRGRLPEFALRARLADHLLARINTICARAGARIPDPRRGTPTARTTGEISFCAAIDAHRIKPK
jgi:hypothetical protein